MKDNRLKRVLAEGGIPVGHMIWEFATRGMAKVLEAAGADFVVIDMEHTAFDAERVADMIAWLKATDIAPFVRVPQRLYHFLARTMDAGALGVMVANVEDADQARSVVDAVKFAPLGGRGVGLGGAHNDYLNPNPAEYFKRSNENTTVICQIESVKGVDHVEAIAAVPGVDVVWIGHFDLTQSMGIPGQFDDPRFAAALARVVAAANKHGKLAAIQPGSLDQARAWVKHGFHFMSYNVDVAVYRNALRNELDQVRAMLKSR